MNASCRASKRSSLVSDAETEGRSWEVGTAQRREGRAAGQSVVRRRRCVAVRTAAALTRDSIRRLTAGTLYSHTHSTGTERYRATRNHSNRCSAQRHTAQHSTAQHSSAALPKASAAPDRARGHCRGEGGGAALTLSAETHPRDGRALRDRSAAQRRRQWRGSGQRRLCSAGRCGVNCRALWGVSALGLLCTVRAGERLCAELKYKAAVDAVEHCHDEWTPQREEEPPGCSSAEAKAAIRAE